MAFSLDIEGRLERTWPFGWRVLRTVKRVDLGFMANSVAFQAFGALLPLLVVTFVLVALVAGDALAEQVLELTEGLLPERTSRLLATAVADQLGSASASVVSVAVLLWGALNLFKGLDTAFSMIYLTESGESLVGQTRDALVIFAVLLLAVVAAVVAGSVPALVRVPLIEYLSPLVLLAALVAVFLPMFVVFPDAAVSWREALPGTVVAAVGWTALLALFQVYVAATSAGEGGVVGAVLLLLTWLYFGSFLLLLGAVVNAVMADVRPVSSPDESPVPRPG